MSESQKIASNDECCKLAEQIRVWEKIIDVQVHFNDVKSKNQTLFISIVTASLAGAGYLLCEKVDSASIFFHIYSIPVLGAFIFCFAFYILDYGIYHNLLSGSVECGKKYEKALLKEMFGSEYFNDTDGLQGLTSLEIEKYTRLQKNLWMTGSAQKLRHFYFIIGSSLLILFCYLNLDKWLCLLNKLQLLTTCCPSWSI